MKTKITLLIAFVSLSISSCVKDYVGHGQDKIALTNDNYMYEGDLYAIYLDMEITKVDALISDLEKIIKSNQGNEQTDKDLEAAKARKGTLNNELVTVPDWLFRRIPKPKPPCPNPTNCDFLGFDFIGSFGRTQLKSVTVYDADGNEVGGTTGQQNPLPRTRGMAVVDDFKMENYSGPVTIKVVTEAGSRLESVYFFESNL
jgi:hypothetical protein